MKKHKAVYSEKYIKYFPFIEGWILIIVLLLYTLLGLFILVGANAGIGFRLFIFCLALLQWFILRKAIVSIGDVITITHTGVIFYNEITKKEQKVLWDDVAAVYYSMYRLKRSDAYLIFLKKEDQTTISYDGPCDYFLPDQNVDGKKLQRFIPSDLLVNETKYDWES